jgi:hypothetical protein
MLVMHMSGECVRDSDFPNVSGIADPLAGEGLVSEYESQDNFNETAKKVLTTS